VNSDVVTMLVLLISLSFPRRTRHAGSAFIPRGSRENANAFEKIYLVITFAK
jgi:hypothetical protein